MEKAAGQEQGQPVLEHGHTRSEIAARFAKGHRVNYLRDWVYGGIDGAVTTFAIVAGVEGAALSTNIILILGAANLLADGFSMAASNYSGTKTEVDDAKRLREMEARHIRLAPEGEREEVRQIFAAKGFDGDDLEKAVAIITASKDRWIDTMMAEEFGVAQSSIRGPIAAGLSTFAAFIICGAVPLAPFVIGFDNSIAAATVATGATFFLIGSLKSRWSMDSWLRSGLETLTIGMTAAGLAYGAGYAIKWLIG